jgi:chemotaxis protein CheX
MGGILTVHETLVLDPVLNLKAAAPLRAAILERRGEPLTLDASGVQRLGALCLQVLIAARHTWVDDARGGPVTLALTPRSPAFDEAVRLFGAETHLADIMLEGASHS